jgi:multicomponent Na+:H+ antiporter subunit F
MTAVLVVSGLLLGIAGLLLVVRITIGPTILDRSMALDVLMSVVVCAIAIDAVRGNDRDGLPTLLALALIGFAGSVAVARFASRAGDVEAELDDISRREDS